MQTSVDADVIKRGAAIVQDRIMSDIKPTTKVMDDLRERFPVKSKVNESRDEALIKKFSEFYETKWNDDYMYTPSDFIGCFRINRHLARYYLMDMLYSRKVFRVKYSNKTFYGKYDLKTIDRFKEFIWMGVEVKYIKPKEEVVEEKTQNNATLELIN